MSAFVRIPFDHCDSFFFFFALSSCLLEKLQLSKNAAVCIISEQTTTLAFGDLFFVVRPPTFLPWASFALFFYPLESNGGEQYI